MKPLILSFTLAAVALSFSAPVMAADQSQDVFNIEDMSGNTVEKRKKKRVKGGGRKAPPFPFVPFRRTPLYLTFSPRFATSSAGEGQ